MLSLEEYKILKEILKMTVAGNGEAKIILSFIQRNIDRQAHFCLHCGSQIRFGHNRIKKWYEANKGAIEIFSDCSKCGEVFQPTSKRNTICKDCK